MPLLQPAKKRLGDLINLLSGDDAYILKTEAIF